MKSFVSLLLLLSTFAIADTPPPGTVKAKTYSGDGNTSITATGSSLNMHLTNPTDLTTVNQGDAGSASWLMSVTSSVLPVNACKETGGNLATIVSELAGPLAVTGTFWQDTQPVSGTVTASSLAEGVPDSAVPSHAIQMGGSDYAGDLQAVKVSSSGLVSVDGSAVTQPVSGTLTVDQGNPGSGAWPVQAVQVGNWDIRNITGTVSLPTGASTSALQSTINTTLGSPFQAGGSIGNSSFGISGTLPAYASTPTFNLGTLNGAATAANQATQITSLSSIDTKTPALGQALAASSVPVVLTASQLSTLTPLSSVTVSGTVTANAGTGTFTVDGSGHTQPVSGTVTSNIGTTNGLALDASVTGLQVSQGSTTSGQKGGLTLGAVTTSSPSYTTAQSSPFSLTTAGALRIDGSATTQPVSGTFWQATQPVSGTFWQATQPVSGTVTANAGSGTFTVSGTVTSNIGTTNGLALDATVSGLEVTQNSTTSGQSGPIVQGATTTSAPSYTTAKTNPLSLTTAGALRVDGSGVTQPVSIATAPVLVAGSAIIGKVGIDQTTPGTTNGVQVNAALPAGSAVIGKVSIDQTTPGTTNLVALAANQSVNVAQINAVTPLMGNGTTGTGSQRVTIASDNTAFSVNSTPVTRAATTVKQAAITIGTSAVRLTTDAGAPSSTRSLLAVQLLSTSTANCYFGSSGVTTTSTTRGVQFFAGQTLSFSNDAGDYYGICDASSQTIFITEQE